MALVNATSHLITSTHDGSGQCCHPAVIDFLTEHGKAAWAGYRYWMVMTPLPYANNAHEDPNILVSNDKTTWVVPDGITNPLDDADGNPEFNNDPDMIYNPVTNELWVYYHRADATNALESRLVRISEDMTCTQPQAIIYQNPWTQVDNKTRSFTFWRESASKWHMWGGGGTLEPPYNIYYAFSEDGINWGEPVQCLNSDGNDPIQALLPDNYAWHFYAKPNYREQRVEFFVHVQGTVSKLYYMQCPMQNLTLFSTPIATSILNPGGSGRWDAGGLYRSAFVIEEDSINLTYVYHLWYTGVSGNSEYYLGYTSGNIGSTFIGRGWW